jgi:hypothetical protein
MFRINADRLICSSLPFYLGPLFLLRALLFQVFIGLSSHLLDGSGFGAGFFPSSAIVTISAGDFGASGSFGGFRQSVCASTVRHT